MSGVYNTLIVCVEHQSSHSHIVNMTSLQKKRGGGIEAGELRSMLSDLEDVKKFKGELETEKDKKKAKRKAEWHDTALNDLTEAFKSWNIRAEPKVLTEVMTQRGVPVSQDGKARHALRKLHEHVKTISFPLATADPEAWQSTLKQLVAEFLAELKDFAIGDPPEIWQPTNVQDPPLLSTHWT